ncbi:MAG: hypothetical protein NC548_15900 [Lachnospiraceae bacterium]|nr:hypothetical protein [Lachnospiraceae bacterium]
MNKVIISALCSDNELFLNNLSLVDFCDDKREALTFDTIKSARHSLSCRFLSFCYWIDQHKVQSVYFCTINENKEIIGREKYIL